MPILRDFNKFRFKKYTVFFIYSDRTLSDIQPFDNVCINYTY